MHIPPLHRWDVTPSEAMDLQKELAGRVVVKSSLQNVRVLAAADVALDPRRNMGFAGVIVYQYPDMTIIEREGAQGPLKFPYIPGLLSFREGPLLLAAFQKLKSDPDVIIFDGQGIAHPRGIGIASHMGLWLDKPTLGIAKSLLVGAHRPLGPKAGAAQPLVFRHQQVGYALRSRDGSQPVFVSPGHRTDLKDCLAIAKACLDGRRVPKPTREADRFVAGMKRVDLNLT